MNSSAPIKAFVAGWPVSHSLSPALHGFWLAEHGIDGCYDKLPVPAENFIEFLQTFSSQGYVGGNITIPHKETAFKGAEVIDETGEYLQAVNTLWLSDGKIHASNTDVYGFAANLDEQLPEWRNRKTAMIIGAGGASRAVIYALQLAGYTSIHILNRTIARARQLVDHFGDGCHAHPLGAFGELASETGMLINATSIGMSGKQDILPFDFASLHAAALVTDIIYTPLRTPFLKLASDRGLKTADGLGMLLHQAVPGFEIWFKTKPKVTPELRLHVQKELENMSAES